jgi:hypothetical protein
MAFSCRPARFGPSSAEGEEDVRMTSANLTQTSTGHGRAVLTVVLLSALVAGTIDIGAASLISGKPPLTILQFVAGGLMGKAALTGGVQAQVLGMLLQWGMSGLIGAIFVLASLRLPILRRQWIAAGLAYGVGVFAVMNYMVVPLSAWARVPHFTAASFAGNLAAMLLFGLLIAGFTRACLKAEPR